jgi:hypothetical protein
VSSVVAAYRFALDPTPEHRRGACVRFPGVRMGELPRQIEYRTGWSGVRLHIANRWYPSSRTCSSCAAVKTKQRLSERTYICGQCGFTLDPDLNAARNLPHSSVRSRAVVAASYVVTAPRKPMSDPHPAGSGPREDPRVNARTARRGIRTQFHMFLNGSRSSTLLALGRRRSSSTRVDTGHAAGPCAGRASGRSPRRSRSPALTCRSGRAARTPTSSARPSLAHERSDTSRLFPGHDRCARQICLFR